MTKFLALLKSKKFWTLVAAIVAALTAFFTTSCAAQAKVRREGIHIDTVRVDYIIRSKSLSTIAQCPENSLRFLQRNSIPNCVPFILVSGNSTGFAQAILSRPVLSSGCSTLQRLQVSNFSRLSSLYSSTKSISSITLTPPYSMEVPQYSSKPLSRTSGERCLIALLPIAFVARSRRRGGRKGRPKGTKTVPLGGSHL